MSQSEILNYDPSLHHPDEKHIELREIVFYDSNKVPISSVYVPVSALVNKKKDEIGLYVLRVFLAHNVDIRPVDPNSEYVEKMSGTIAETFAHYYARYMVVNLMTIYAKRINRGDGTDPEIEIVDEPENCNQSQETVDRESEAVYRIVDHLFTKLKTGLANYLVDRSDIIAEFWYLVLRNITANTMLLMGEKKGDTSSLSKEEFVSEFLSISKELWWGIFYQTFESAGQRIASKVLEKLNPVGMRFEELKEMLRGGLDAWPTFQEDDLHQLVKGIKKVIDRQGVTFRVSGDGRSFAIELPKASALSNSDRLVDRQDALIKYLLEPPKRGRRPDPNKPLRLREYAKFAELTHKRKEIAEYLNEFAREHSTDQWFKMLTFADRFKYLCDQYENKGHDRTIILETAKTVYDYHQNTGLMIKDKTKWDRAVSPLGIAQILASLEIGWRDDKGAPLDPTILRDRYNQVACDWKMKDGMQEEA